MREIKFRGKSLDNGEWVNGFVLFSQDKSETVIAKLTATESVCENVDPDTVGQFTGLHDKNGKEIYEGDILRDPHSGEVGVVEWSSMWLQYWLSICNSPSKEGLPFLVELGYTVVGNIHDNPELLKTE